MSKYLDKLKELFINDAKLKHPNYPVEYIACYNYNDKAANGLTRCVVDFLNFSGHQAERISSTGRYIDNTKIVSDTLGRRRTIGSGQYIKGSGTNGTADISSTIKVNVNGRILGLSVKWEVKMKDKQSGAQKQYQVTIEESGGVYHIVTSFDDFYNKYLLIINVK